MTFEAWLFSAKRAWQNHWVKAVTIVTACLLLATTVWFSAKVISLRHVEGGQLVLHYSVELGIDAIRPWAWALFLPAVWLMVTVLDLLWAFGIYRDDVYQSWAFFGIALAWSIPWMLALWHLIRINQ